MHQVRWYSVSFDPSCLSHGLAFNESPYQISLSRDFQFKVKGISMSVFNEEDVRALSNEGNVSFNAKYLANYNTHDPLPNGSDVNKLKEFIKSKYLDKRWHVDSASSRGGGGGGGGGHHGGSDGFGAFDNNSTHSHNSQTNNNNNTSTRAASGNRRSVRMYSICL